MFKNLLRLNLLPKCSLPGVCSCAVKKNMHAVPSSDLNFTNMKKLFLHNFIPPFFSFFFIPWICPKPNWHCICFSDHIENKKIMLNTCFCFYFCWDFPYFIFYLFGFYFILCICIRIFRWSHVTYASLELTM